MRNTFIDKLESSVKVVIEGKNVNNYIKRVIKDKINIINLKYLDYNKVEITIKYNDYLKLKDHRSIYKLKVIEKYGKLKIKDKLKKNYILLLFLLIGIFIIVFLSNIIFNIEIIHSNKEIIELVEKELKNNGIEKYGLKKSYQELEQIEDKILENNKTTLEWIEIEVVGTKYIIRIEERKIKENNTSNKYQNIVMGKSGILKKIIATSGEKVKEINTFASKDNVVISGIITKPNGETIYTSASGSVYATVWYTINVEYPYHYKEEVLTGKSKEVYYIKLFNKRISLLDFNKYKNFQSEPNIIISNNIFPISLIKEKQYEVNIIDEIYTKEEIINKAIELSERRLLSSNSKIESINEVNVISKENLDSKIKLKLFLSVTEEVSEIKVIDIEEIEKRDN